jgi:hypothetical protein
LALLLGGCSGKIELGTNDGGDGGGDVPVNSGFTSMGNPTPVGGSAPGSASAPSEDSSDSGSGFVDPAQCKSECTVAATVGCNLEAAAGPECQELCANSPTASQLTCLQASPCKSLVAALAGHASICGIPTLDASVGNYVDCRTDCENAVNLAFSNSCYLNPTAADVACEALCAKEPSASMVNCFQTISCVTLVNALDGGPLCDANAADAGADGE